MKFTRIPRDYTLDFDLIGEDIVRPAWRHADNIRERNSLKIGTMKRNLHGKLGYMRETPVYLKTTLSGIINPMSKNVFSGSDANRKPDNPQETYSHFYYPGFFAAEMSCSVIKAANHPHGYYYAVDITVSNADRQLLEQVNTAVMKGRGVISAIKGGFNLSARGKDKVRIVLEFLRNHPIIAGDLAKNRIVLLERALLYLETNRGHKAHQAKTKAMDTLRRALRQLKEKGIVETAYDVEKSVSNHAIGYFLSGIIDGEGSFGIKASVEPYFFIAMKDKKIVELFSSFIRYGNVRYRKDGVYHCEINKRDVLKNVCSLFLERYPLRHARQRERLQKLQRILNDHTPRPLLKAA